MQWKKGMGALDFSAFHDIWMEDFEGNLKPMDEPYYNAKLIAPGTWQVLSAGDYTYVIEGDDEVIVIDSGNGAGNIREFCLLNGPVRKTQKPIHAFSDFLPGFKRRCGRA